ncbi:hypothetical protein PDK93_17765 [Bacillus cereus]|nr:hypothetical protein [Bacillus cereus]
MTIDRPRPDLTGIWQGNANSHYYIREIGDAVWWLGLADNNDYGHRPFDHNFVNVFTGIRTDNYISGSWSDIPRGYTYNSGILEFQFFSGALIRNSETGGFGEYLWLPVDNDQGRTGGYYLPIPVDNDQGRTEELTHKLNQSVYKIEEKHKNLTEMDDPKPTYPFNFTGWYHCDDKGDYWIRQVGNEVWWNGRKELDNGVVEFSNVFHGIIQAPEKENYPYHITGEWVDVPEGQTTGSGTLTLVFGQDIGGNFIFEKEHGYGSFGGKVWYPAAYDSPSAGGDPSTSGGGSKPR